MPRDKFIPARVFRLIIGLWHGYRHQITGVLAENIARQINFYQKEIFLRAIVAAGIWFDAKSFNNWCNLQFVTCPVGDSTM